MSTPITSYIALGGLAFTALLLAIMALVHITQRYRRAESRGLAVALNNMSNGLLAFSSDYRVTLFNPRVTELFDLEPADIWVGMQVHTYLAIVGRRVGWDQARIDRVYRNHIDWIQQNAITRVEHHFDDGKVLSISCRPMQWGGAIMTYDDVTEARQHQQKILHLAYHDELTGLANRRSFTDQLARKLATGPATVMLIDLDHFKHINDNFGHDVGDKLLVELSRRLREFISDDVTPYRIGGDEMAMLSTLTPSGSEELASLIVASLASPFDSDGEIIMSGCSIGTVHSDVGASPADILKMADVALYEAKNRGRGRVQIYERGMMEEMTGRVRIENELRRAIAGNELVLHYQPIYSLPDKKLHGFEALVRWCHPRLGLQSPDAFIPIAERSGLIVEIGAWVIDEACRQAALWPNDLVIALNVSPVQLRSPGILKHLVSAMDRHGIYPGRIELEVTETALIEKPAAIAATLSGLRALGVKILMDDFGTGFSSLAHLRELELDRIKVDRSFVASVLDDHDVSVIVRAMVAMATELGLTIVAEGVETDAQLEWIINVGCSYAQGYGLGKPMPAAEAAKLFEVRMIAPDPVAGRLSV